MDPTQAAGDQLTAERVPIACAFCERPAVARCSHRLAESWIVYPHEVRVGDMIEHSLTLEFYRCIEVRPPTRPLLWTDALRCFSIEAAAAVEPDPYVLILAIGTVQSRAQSHSQTLPLLKRESRKCRRPACDRHLRDQGDEHYQCAAHWEDWKVYSPDA